MPGATGWAGFAADSGISDQLWLPRIATTDRSFGVETNGFGFDINWAAGQTVVVSACADLGNPVWVPLATNMLTSAMVYFSDPQWTNYPNRFYSVSTP